MNKAEQFLIELSRASAEVKRLSAAIGDALSSSIEEQQADGGLYTDHLNAAYQIEYEEDDFTGRTRRYHANHDGDVAAYLAARCKHSLRAHELIQERKAARKRLGIARRNVTSLSNRLAKEAP